MKRAIIGLWAVLGLSASAAAQDVDALVADIKARYDQQCFSFEREDFAESFPTETWPLTWRYEDDGEGAPENEWLLIRVFCYAGAYNVTHLHFLWDELDGLRPLHFAVPAFTVRYANDDYDGEVLGIDVEGFTTLQLLTNSEFDPDTRTIQDAAHWRGLGDASSSGVWAFERGDFVLRTYDVDASYDGEINPERIVDFTGGGAPHG